MDLLLACGAGGHTFQLFALRQSWSGYSCAWLTEPGSGPLSHLHGEPVFHAFTPTDRNLSQGVHRIAYAWLRNSGLAWRMIRRLRPKVFLTTGAALAVPFAWVARLHGVRVVYVESITRIDRPSVSCRLIAPVADRVYAQWPELARAYPRAQYAGSVAGALAGALAQPAGDGTAHTAPNDVFVSVGSTVRFDRLVRAVDALPEELSVLVQRGPSEAPKRAQHVDFLSFDELAEQVRRARAVVVHAGAGSVLTAWSNGKRPIVVPRLRRFGEAVDDHQLEFAQHLERAGLVTLVTDLDELPQAVSESLGGEPPVIDPDQRLVDSLRDFVRAHAGDPC